jgi:hypothetical protein
MKTPIPEHVKKNLGRLHRWANGIYGLYGVPVYLVGSALSDSNPDPRDWDVRITLPDKEFAVRFGDPQAWVTEGATGIWTRVRWHWADECVKRAKSGWYACRLNIDFQIYPRSHVRRIYPASFPRLRIDTRSQP